jgi:multimeric flavodoxin WrbA
MLSLTDPANLSEDSPPAVKAAAEGAAGIPGVEAWLRPVEEVTAEELEAAAALILASPTHWANMSWPVARLIRDWPYMGDKVGAAIATGGAMTGGREHVVISLLLAMLNNGMIVVGPVYEEDGFRFGSFGAATVTGPRDPGVDDEALEDARRPGRRVAETGLALRRSGTCAQASPSQDAERT